MEKQKMKIWKKILIIIGIILVIFVVRTARNMVIIKILCNKANKYQDTANYHITIYGYQGNMVNVSHTYKKDDKYLVKVDASNGEHIRKIINYCDGKTVNTYLEADEAKIAMLNSNGLPTAGQITNYMETDSLWQFISMSATSKIKSEVCNGKKCYKIGNLLPVSIVMYKNEEEYRELCQIDFGAYIDKETGLIVRMLDGTVGEGNDKINMVTDYKYEFDTVTDEDLKEPDIDEYKVINGDEVIEYEHLVPDINKVEIQIQDKTSQNGIKYTEPLKLENHYKLYDLSVIINDSEKIDNFDEIYGAGDYFEGCPIVTIYMKNGEKMTVIACDNFAKDENGKFINIMEISRKDDFSDKEIYKVNDKLMKFIEELYEQNM